MAGGGALKKLLKRQKLMIDGKIIQPGDKVITGKGEEYIFDSIQRYNEQAIGGNSSGKIVLRDPTIEEGKPFSTVVYYPSVVGGELIDPTTTLKRVKRRGGRIRNAKGGKISRRDLLKGLGAGALAAGAGAAGLGKVATKTGALDAAQPAAIKAALNKPRVHRVAKGWFEDHEWSRINKYLDTYREFLRNDIIRRNPDVDEFPHVLVDEMNTIERIQALPRDAEFDKYDDQYLRSFLEDQLGEIEDTVGSSSIRQDQEYRMLDEILGDWEEFNFQQEIPVEKAGGGAIKKALKYKEGPALHDAAMKAAAEGDAAKALEYLKQLQDILQLSDEDFSKMLGAQFDRGPQSGKYVPEVEPDLDAPVGGYKHDKRAPDSKMRMAEGGTPPKGPKGALIRAAEVFARRQGKVKSPDIEIPSGFESFYTKQYPDRVDIIGVKKDGKEQIVDNIGPGFGDLDSMVLAKELASIYNTGGFSNAYVSRPKLEDLFPPAPPPPPKASVTQIRGGQRAPEGNRLRSFQEHLQNLTKTGNVGVDELQDLSDVAREALSPEDFEIFLEQLDGDGLISPSQGTRQVPYEPDVTVQMGGPPTELRKILAEMGLSPDDMRDPSSVFRRLSEMSDEMEMMRDAPPGSIIREAEKAYKRPMTYEEHLMETPPARMTLDELEDAFDHDFMTEDDYMFFQESFVDLEDDMMDLLKDYHPSGFEDINDIEVFPNPRKENEHFVKVRYLGDDDLYYFRVFEDEVTNLNGPDDIPPRFAEGGEVKKDKTAMDYLRAVGQSLGGALPFIGEEAALVGADVGEQIYKKAAYPLAGLTSQWWGVNPTTDEFEYAGPGADMIHGRGRPSYPMEELQMIDPEEYHRQYLAWRDWKDPGETEAIPGIIDETALLPAMPQMIEMMTDMDEIETNPDYEPFIGAPEWSLEASDRAAENWERSLAKFGLPEPEGFVENALMAGGMMVGQIPVPTAWLGRLRALFPGAKSTEAMVENAGRFGWLKAAAGSAPEFLFPTIDPKTANYVTASLFGGGLMTMLAPGEEVPEDIPPDIASLIQRHNQGDGEATKLLQEILDNHNKEQERESQLMEMYQQIGRSSMFAGGGKVRQALNKFRISPNMADELEHLEIATIDPEHSDPERIAFAQEIEQQLIAQSGKKRITLNLSDQTMNYLLNKSLPNMMDIWYDNDKTALMKQGERILQRQKIEKAKGGKISRRDLLKGLGAGAVTAGAAATGLGKAAVKQDVLPMAAVKEALAPAAKVPNLSSGEAFRRIADTLKWQAQELLESAKKSEPTTRIADWKDYDEFEMLKFDADDYTYIAKQIDEGNYEEAVKRYDGLDTASREYIYDHLDQADLEEVRATLARAGSDYESVPVSRHPDYEQIASELDQIDKNSSPEQVSRAKRLMRELIDNDYDVEESWELAINRHSAKRRPKAGGGRIRSALGNSAVIGEKTYTPQRVDKGNKLVMVDAKALDQLWSQNKDNYVSTEGKNQIGKRIEQFKKYLAENDEISVGSVYYDKKGGLSFGDGRHRARVMIDSGMEEIPISMEPKQIEALQAELDSLKLSDELPAKAEGGRITRSQLLKMAKGGKISRRELLKGLGAAGVAGAAGAAGLGKMATKTGVLDEVPAAAIKKALEPSRVRDLATSVRKSDFSPVEWERIKTWIDDWSEDWNLDAATEARSGTPDGDANAAEFQRWAQNLESINELDVDAEFSQEQKAALMDMLEDVEENSSYTSGEGNPDWIELEDDYDFTNRLNAEFHTPASFKKEAWKNALEAVPNPSPKVREIFDLYVNDARLFEDRMEYGIEDLAFSEGTMPGESALFERLSKEEAKQLQRMIHASPDGTFTHF